MKQMLTTLTQVIFEIFGDMFFMFPDHYDEGENVAFPKDWIKYKIKIAKEKTFWLNFYFTPQQTKLMAENFLGEEAGEISDVLIAETIKEAVNVMGGNLLNRLDGDYILGIPEKCSTEDVLKLKNFCNDYNSLLLNIEEQPFLSTTIEE
jgi:hypothetical protein